MGMMKEASILIEEMDEAIKTDNPVLAGQRFKDLTRLCKGNFATVYELIHAYHNPED